MGKHGLMDSKSLSHGEECVIFDVAQEHLGGLGMPSVLGSVSVPVEELFEGAMPSSVEGAAGAIDVFQGQVQELEIVRGGYVTGRVTVQATLRTLPDARILNHLKGCPSTSIHHHDTEAEVSDCDSVATDKTPMPCWIDGPVVKRSPVQELADQLRGWAQKYPKRGKSIWTAAKDRYFVLNSAEADLNSPHVKADQTQDVRGTSLRLEWYKTEGVPGYQHDPLDFLWVSQIRKVHCQREDNPEPMVTVDWADRKSGEWGQLVLLFYSKERAVQWTSDMQKCLEFAKQP